MSAQKAALRQEIRRQLAGLTPARRLEAAEGIRKILTVQRRWEEARSVLLYAPLPDEVDIGLVIGLALASQKVVALPRFNQEQGHYSACQVRDLKADLRPGRFGIPEPAESCAAIPLNRLDLILVPGVAFDLSGRRLGRGKGFYDRMLAEVRGTACGVAFDEQIVGNVPVEPHDSDVNCILTPTRWIEL